MNNKERIKPSEISEVLFSELRGVDLSAQYAEVGTVLQVSDGVVRIYGLQNAEANELLEFENGLRAVVMNLEEDNVGAVLLGSTDRVEEGDTVRRTGCTASIDVGMGMLGRVIDPLGQPIDGLGEITGDIFYLHSRLLERAAKIIGQQEVAEQMNDLPESLRGKVRGGGSLTALPIIETQAGDVSAYIPTNVISITDGQIFLDTNLFNQGNRPAIDVGISVSRVGGSAQIKAMKQVAGTLKIDQAQYRELESFSRFSSDLDPVTAATLDRGRKNTRLLVQPQYSPLSVEEQIAVLYCGTHGLLRDVPIEKVAEFEHLLLERLRTTDIPEALHKGQIDEELGGKIEELAASVTTALKA